MTWGGDDIGVERAVREPPLRGGKCEGEGGMGPRIREDNGRGHTSSQSVPGTGNVSSATWGKEECT